MPTLIAKAGTKRRILHVPAIWALLLQSLPIGLAGIERQGPRPHEGVRSSYTTGFGYGVWYALLHAAGIPFIVVAPGQWKRHWGLVKATKAASIVRALERYPQVGTQPRMTEGQAEALLIAGYVRAQLHEKVEP